uniref:ATPase family AAA domain-containing protein 5 n=1 Tax=Cacopsylla melanoneura TaxID=428564 RepID=A0A8D9FAZ0_9HEMI
MSEEESPPGDKAPAKKKVRKRKSKIDHDEDYTEEIKAQRKPKKIKVVEQKQNSSLLKWLNTSADKSQASTSNSPLENGRVSQTNLDHETTKVSTNMKICNNSNSSVQICSPNSKSNPPIVDELISQIDFSSLKSKLNSKLLASPKRQPPITKTENGVSASPNKTDSSVKNNKKNTNEERISSNSKNTPGKKVSKSKVSAKEKDEATKTIQAMFKRMKQHKAEINGKLNKTENDCDDSDDDNELYESFMDSDDEGGMIFLSNRNTRHKVVDSTDNESMDSYANTPVKNGEIMAPPYSPLSPLVRKSRRDFSKSPSASRSPNVKRSPKIQGDQSPATSKQLKSSPASNKTKSLQTENSPLKTPKSAKKNKTESPAQKQISEDSTSTSSLTEKCKISPQTATKNLFGTKQGKEKSEDTEKDLGKACSETNRTPKCEQDDKKSSNKKRKSKKKDNNEVPKQDEQSVNNLSVASDEDFKTPKKKVKPGKKKSTENKPVTEKPAKEVKVKKKDVSPNVNSSLLNYFKKVDKDIIKTVEDGADNVVNVENGNTVDNPEERNADVSSEKVSNEKIGEIEKTESAKTSVEYVSDSKERSDTSLERSKKSKKKKKKHKSKKKRSDCVEIRFDFESESSDVGDKLEDNRTEVLDNKCKGNAMDQSESEQMNCKKTKEDNQRLNETQEVSLESANCNERSEDELNKQLTGNESNQTSNNACLTEDIIDMEDQEKDVKTMENQQLEDKEKGVKPCDIKQEDSKVIGKKKKRGRPKKEKPKEELESKDVKDDDAMETTANETIEESEEIEGTQTEMLEEVEGSNEDNKENKKIRTRRERKSKDKKELTEHCENATDEGEEERKVEESGSGSLFKYFKKVDSIPDSADKKENGSTVMKVEVQVHTPPTTPSKWKRKSSAAATNRTPIEPISSTSTDEQVNSEENSGGGGRRKSSRISEKKAKQEKRRSVEDEIVVMEDEEKEEKKKSGKGKTEDEEDDLFIVKEKKLSTVSSAPPSKVKLASIFVKKPKLSKQETEARQKFLQSGVPDAIRRQTELLRKQEELLEELSYYTFPLINHVTQHSSDHLSHDTTKDTPDLGPFKLKLQHESNNLPLSNDQKVTDHSQWTSFMVEEKKSKCCEGETEEWTVPTKVDKALSVLKKRVPTIEQTSVFKQVLSSLDKKSAEIKPSDPSPVVWSEKYRPEHENDILGNRQGVELLRAWLETQKKQRPLCNDSSDEDADFIDDNDSSSQFDNRHNTAILIGPSGSGKTCTVYALANQLGFKVIELNASCNRNGKRILSDLSEATQSHQVHHNQQTLAPQANSISAFFTKQLNGGISKVGSPRRNLATGFSSLAKHLSNGGTLSEVEEIDIASDNEETSSTGRSNGKRKRSASIDRETKPETSGKKKRGRPSKGDSKTRQEIVKKDEESGETLKHKEGNRKSNKRKDKEFIDDDESEDEVVSKDRTSKKKPGVKRNGRTSLDNTPTRHGRERKTRDNEKKEERSVSDIATQSSEPSGDGDTAADKPPALSSEDNSNSKSSMSVILIEDADVIFSEHDEGFIAALAALVASSKRPLIMVTNSEKGVPHLTKFSRMSTSLVVKFETPLYAEIGCFLQLVAILEGVKLSQDKSLLLIQHNAGDIRKCLLILQFYVLSNRPYPTQSTPPWSEHSLDTQLHSLWWEWSTHYSLEPLIHNHTHTKLTRQDFDEDNQDNEEQTYQETCRNRERKLTNQMGTKDNANCGKKTSFLDDEFFVDADDDDYGDEKTNIRGSGEDRNNELIPDKIAEAGELDVDKIQENETKNCEPIEDMMDVDSNENIEMDVDEENTRENVVIDIGKTNDGASQTNCEQDTEGKNDVGIVHCEQKDDVKTDQQISDNVNYENKNGKTNTKIENGEILKETNEEIDSAPNSEESGYHSIGQCAQSSQELSQESENSSEKTQEISQKSTELSQKSQESSQKSEQLSQEPLSNSYDDENIQFIKSQFSCRFQSKAELQTVKTDMQALATMLSCVSQVDLTLGTLGIPTSLDSNPCPQACESYSSASSSLTNDTTAGSLHTELSANICASIIQCGRGLIQRNDGRMSVNGAWEQTKRSTLSLFSLEHSLRSSLPLSHRVSPRGSHLDLYSGVRGLARSEQNRFQESKKRYNRFFNHLKSVNIHLSKSDTERLCASLRLE